MTDTSVIPAPDGMTEGPGAGELERPATSGSPALTPMDMLQMAVQQNADLEKLEKLMALQERWEANEARKAYVEALGRFKANPPTVVKNKRAGFGSGGGRTEYEYATLPQIIGVIAPVLSGHGLSHTWSTEQGEQGISVTCTLTHVLGHSESVTLSAGADTSGSKNSIQAIGSTVTYLQRYTLLAITGLAAAEMDDDAAGVEPTITDEQKAKLIARIREVGADTTRFLNYLGVQAIDFLPAKHFDSAMKALDQKEAEQ